MGQGPAECIECMRQNQCSLRRAADNAVYHLQRIKSTRWCHRAASRPRPTSSPVLPQFKCTSFTSNSLAFTLICKYSFSSKCSFVFLLNFIFSWSLSFVCVLSNFFIHLCFCFVLFAYRILFSNVGSDDMTNSKQICLDVHMNVCVAHYKMFVWQRSSHDCWHFVFA